MTRQFVANEMAHAIAHVRWHRGDAIYIANNLTVGVSEEVPPHAFERYRKIMIGIRNVATIKCSCDSCKKLGL